MPFPPVLRLGLALLCCSACAHTLSTADILAHYHDSVKGSHILPASDYIDWLRTTRFTKGELDSIPETAFILHDSRAGVLMGLLPTYGNGGTRTLDIGTTDPSRIYIGIVADRSFLLTAGLPGAGGIATQVAELGALGVKRVVHIGTAGMLGSSIPDSALVVSRGSLKDGAAILLGSGTGRDGPIASGDSLLAEQLDQALAQAGIRHARGVGATIPVFYDQPVSYIKWLLVGQEFQSTTRPSYVEMEEAPFFEQAHLSGMAAASIVVGSDRYGMAGDSLRHTYVDLDQFGMEIAALRVAVRALAGIELGERLRR